jgi:hypothetical protein
MVSVLTVLLQYASSLLYKLWSMLQLEQWHRQVTIVDLLLQSYKNS